MDGVLMHRFGKGSLFLGRGYKKVVLPWFRNNALLVLSSFFLAVSVSGWHADVCLQQNFLDPSGFGLLWIRLDSVSVHGVWSIYMIFTMSSSPGR